MTWVSAVNKIEARAKIQGNNYLDQQYSWKKRPLKISLNSRDNQANKKTTIPKAKASQDKQDSKDKKFFEKVKKE